jgi:Tfp pilus assembly protein PilF
LIVLLLFLGTHSAQAASDESVERNRGLELLNQGKVNEAIGPLLKAIAANPKDPDIRLGLAYAYDRQGRLDEAIIHYQGAIELNPRNSTALNNLGVLYEKKGNYDEAIRQFEKAVEIDPRSATGLKNLETAKKNQSAIRERERKIADALKNVESNPENPKAHYSLARAYAFYGKKDLAIASLEKALKLGYSDIGYIKVDTALESIRNEPDYVWLLRGK